MMNIIKIKNGFYQVHAPNNCYAVTFSRDKHGHINATVFDWDCDWTWIGGSKDCEVVIPAGKVRVKIDDVVVSLWGNLRAVQHIVKNRLREFDPDDM